MRNLYNTSLCGKESVTMMKQKHLQTLALTAVMTALLFAGCANTQSSSQSEIQVQTPAPTQQPVDTGNANPLTGLPKGEDYPEGQRPVAVMINNIKAALPQSGLNDADLLYEVVTEGGITRIMAVYRDYTTMPTVGPVRSARDQHVQLMLPIGALYAHIGASTYAQEMLETYKWEDLFEIDGIYRNFYWIDAERRQTRAQEHCVFTDGESFSRAVEEFNMSTTGFEPEPVFSFVDYDQPKRTLNGGDAQKVYVRFSGYASSVFEYHDGKYYKSEFGEPQMDMATNSQLAVDNLLVLFAETDKYPDGILTHVNYDWGGTGYYFFGGQYEKIRWKKGTPEQPLLILDAEGNETEVQINPGNTYVAIVGNDQIENFSINEAKLNALESNQDEEIEMPDR